jgi:hypothetical protein
MKPFQAGDDATDADARPVIFENGFSLAIVTADLEPGSPARYGKPIHTREDFQRAFLTLVECPTEHDLAIDALAADYATLSVIAGENEILDRPASGLLL